MNHMLASCSPVFPGRKPFSFAVFPFAVLPFFSAAFAFLCSPTYSKFLNRIESYSWKDRMTSVDVVFKYLYPPTENVMRAMDNVREVYGIRRIRFQEAERTIRVEYDATRLNQDTVAALLRRTGLELGEKLQLV